MYHMLALALCVSASEEFDWTKNERTSFYYGTFPTGRTHINNNIIIHKLPKDSLNFSLGKKENEDENENEEKKLI